MSTATREAYGDALVELGEKDGRIVVLDADLSKSTRTDKFAARFPERFFQMGIAEQDMIGFAAGLATTGKIPFVSTFAVFATGRTYDQIRMCVAYSLTNVKICASHAGLTVGEDGASHQALEDITLMRVLPNMKVIVPADAVETRKAVFAAAEEFGPVYIRLGRPPVPAIFGEDYSFKIGKGVVLRRGEDAAIISCGIMTERALRAAEALESEGVMVTVLHLPTVKPLDEELILSVAHDCGAVVTAEEHSVVGGLGGAVAELLAESHPVPMRRVGVRDQFGRSGGPWELMSLYGLDPKDICEAVKGLIERKRG